MELFIQKSATWWRWVVFCFVVFCGQMACKTTSTQTKKAKSVWQAPEPIEILRGLKTGDEPADVERLLCQRWSWGRCSRLQRLYSSAERAWPQVFLYEEREGAYPCHHRFFFGRWGLSKIVSSCEVYNVEQAASKIRRYVRWFGKFEPREENKDLYLWNPLKQKGLVHRVAQKGRILIASHQDTRMDWLKYLQNIEPAQSLVSKEQWALWQSASLSLRREVLRNLARVLFLWQTRVKDEHLLFRLQEAGWNRPVVSLCVAKKADPSRWQGEPWKTIGFVPDTPIALRYRFRWKVPLGERKTRFFFRRSRTPFSLEAEGCGYRFLLKGERLDGGFENLLDFKLTRVYVERI
ncbi:MAG: hypothetical protein H6728_07570 [Myxococcales bacterium]|nr:hypothetical protein [Myxococcales bacterium]